MCTVKFSATVHLPCVAVTKEEFLVLSKRRYRGSKARAAIIKEKLMPALLANAILLFTAAESIEKFFLPPQFCPQFSRRILSRPIR